MYTKAGNSLNAAVITDESAVIDHKLYWAHAHPDVEAWYLCAIFNSETFREEVVGYQPVGLFGPRDFDKYVFEVPFPRFEQSDPLHKAIADAGQRAAVCAESVQLDGSEYFTTARSLIRDALDSTGLSDEIDTLVLDLLTRPSR